MDSENSETQFHTCLRREDVFFICINISTMNNHNSNSSDNLSQILKHSLVWSSAEIETEIFHVPNLPQIEVTQFPSMTMFTEHCPPSYVDLSIIKTIKSGNIFFSFKLGCLQIISFNVVILLFQLYVRKLICFVVFLLT